MKVNQHEYLSEKLSKRYKQWDVVTSEDSTAAMILIDWIRSQFDILSLTRKEFDLESTLFIVNNKIMFIFGPVNVMLTSPSINPLKYILNKKN